MQKTRIEFIKALNHQLSYVMKPEEVKDVVDYYDEMILDSMEEGLSEEEAVSRLDAPEEIRKSIENTPLEIDLPISKKFSPYMIALLILGFPLWGSLLLAAVLLVFSIYLVIWCIPLITGAIGFAGIIGGIASTTLSPLAFMDGFHIGATQFGLGLVLFGIGVLAALLTSSISKSVIGRSQKVTRQLKNQLFHQTNPSFNQ